MTSITRGHKNNGGKNRQFISISPPRIKILTPVQYSALWWRGATLPPLSRTTREPLSPQRTVVRPQSSTIAVGVRSCSVLFLSSSALRRAVWPIAARGAAYCGARRCLLRHLGGLLRRTARPIRRAPPLWRSTRRSPWCSGLGGIARA